MGKYMRKAKVTSDIAVMELSQSSLGVKTRAKTLALQKLEAANSIQDSSCYLQLRNRRLEKTNDAVKTLKSGAKESFKQNPDGNLKDLEGKSRRLNSGHVGSESGRDEKGCENGRNEDAGCFDLGVEASFGENNLEFDARERSTRESTPCSLIRGSDSITNPGSSTKPRSLAASDRETRNSMQQDIPTTHEIEEFFALAEQQQQKRFTEKYNFDVVNDIPLPGRYQWVRIYP
ncbi:cyclin-dependent kinase inhibitor 3-like [Apium graveolens]|uniref:cyclin-dependent kinase inhibitor 3-like n=1 Tax=Apium graveolens TaxID=4045 RepID=UPI003D7C0081